MRRLADFSIRGKLLSMSVLSSGMALLLACVAFLAYELVTFRHSMVQTLGTQAEMLGYNITAPLLFNDADAAGSILEALRANDHILAAGIFDRDGRLFARYPHRGQGQP